MIGGGSERNRIANNQVYSNPMYGISIGAEEGDFNTFISNIVWQNDVGIYLNAGDYAEIKDNIVHDNFSDGIYIEGAAVSNFRNTGSNR